MPSGEEIQRYLTGAWRLMTGRQDGLALLDLSADGFWTSFSAIAVALPVLLATWVPVANEACGPDATLAIRLAFLGRLAAVDVATWIAPLAAFVLVARPLGIADRLVPYVVASNWGGALAAWLMLPVALSGLFWPDAGDMRGLVALIMLVVALVLFWRLTNAALDKGPAMATGVFVGSRAVELASLLMLQSLLGVPPS